MEIETTRFGRMQIERDDVVRFPSGLLGLEDCRDWILLGDVGNDAVAWLQSIEQPGVALAVVCPRRFIPRYQLRVTRHELAPLLLDELKSAQVLVIASRTERSIALNLRAPLVINLQRRLGRQVVGVAELPIRFELPATQPTLKKSA